jgi:predicted DNA-binding transcriptional regulator AlpA
MKENHPTGEIVSPLLTEKQTAAYLNRSASSLRRDRKNGTGPRFVRLGHSIRYARTELDAYLSALMNSKVTGVPNA